MEISDELKRKLIADVENICELTLDKETKESLMRCFEITIGTHEPKLVLSGVNNLENTVCDDCFYEGTSKWVDPCHSCTNGDLKKQTDC